MNSSPPATPNLDDIATLLRTAGAHLVQLQQRTDGDPLPVTNAYAVLLGARAELADFLSAYAPLGDELRPAEAATVADMLGELREALGAHARASDGSLALACTRAALYVDNARRQLVGDKRG